MGSLDLFVLSTHDSEPRSEEVGRIGHANNKSDVYVVYLPGEYMQELSRNAPERELIERLHPMPIPLLPTNKKWVLDGNFQIGY